MEKGTINEALVYVIARNLACFNSNYNFHIFIYTY